MTDLDPKYLLNHAFAYVFMIHNKFEQVIVGDIQLFPSLACSHVFLLYYIMKHRDR